jgi:hypothetical protein
MTSFSYTTGNPSNLTGGTTASMNDISGPFTDVRTFLNGGNIDSTNLAAGPTLLATQQAWQTLAVSCTNWAGGNLAYFKDSLGIVHFRGDQFVASTGAVSTGATIGTLPAGYRPGTKQYFPVMWSAGSVFAQRTSVDTAGVIKFEDGLGASGFAPSMGSVHFRAEN